MGEQQPHVVQRTVDRFRRAGFGEFLFVTGTPGGSWEVGVQGEHVRATAGFEFRGGKTKSCPGTFTLDGEPHPLVADLEELRRVWDEHEGAPAPAPALMEITDPGDEPVPMIVRLAAESMAKGTEGRCEVRTGRCGPHWVTGVDMPGGDGLRMVFTRYRSWSTDRHQPFQVIAGGVDRSAEAGDNIGEALSVLMSKEAPPDAPAAPRQPVRKQASRRDQGVETRGMVVIRE